MDSNITEDLIVFRFDHLPDTPYLQEELEILYVLSGRVSVNHAGSSYLLGQEDFTVFNPFELHEVQIQKGSHTLSAMIPPEFLRQCRVGDIRCCSSVQTEMKEYHALIRARLALIFRDYLESTEQRGLYIAGGVVNLLAILKQYFETGESGIKQGQNANERIREAVMYVGTHYYEELTLESVAKANYVSAGHLSRQFRKMLGISFSEYLNSLRVSAARRYLLRSKSTVAEISEQCGYGNVNSMISNFQKAYGMTPGAFRRQHTEIADSADEVLDTDPVHFVKLLNHVNDTENTGTMSMVEKEPVIIHADMHSTKGGLALAHNCSMTFGYAKKLFANGVMDTVRRSVDEIGFRYIFVQGIFDDGMGVYAESHDGSPEFDFTYLDMVTDFIVDTGAKPWLELSRTPKELIIDPKESFFGGYVQLPDRTEKWCELVKAFCEHVKDRYGERQIETWRISLFPPFYISYGVFTAEDYLRYHKSTIEILRQHLPGAAVVSGAFDVGLMRVDGNEYFKEFIKFCKAEDCMPDELGFQSFSIDYSRQPRTYVENRIRFDRSKLFEEPAPPFSDPDILHHDIELIEELLEETGAGKLPVCFVYWNSTIWDNDLGSDTCFKAAYVVKNVLENHGRVTALNYSHSFIDDGNTGGEVFAGRHGVISSGGVPKAAYNAFRMLSHLREKIVAQGNGYIITSSDNGEEIRIMIYHYCHYDLDVRLDKFIPRAEQLTIDRYFGFDDPGSINFRMYLSGLDSGEYRKETWFVNRTQGSSYDLWRKIGAPKELSLAQQDYISRMSDMGYKYEQLTVHDDGKCLMSAILEPHEIQLISLKKTD